MSSWQVLNIPLRNIIYSEIHILNWMYTSCQHRCSKTHHYKSWLVFSSICLLFISNQAVDMWKMINNYNFLFSSTKCLTNILTQTTLYYPISVENTPLSAHTYTKKMPHFRSCSKIMHNLSFLIYLYPYKTMDSNLTDKIR